MLNTNNFESLIKPVQNNNRKYFQDLLSKSQIGFSDISNFPKRKGLYFLYYQNTLLYIGSAYASSRTIQLRCRQYLQEGSGGESFRGKIERLQSKSAIESIEFIKNNIFAKFITFEKLDEGHIRQLEQIAICCYQPPLNFILKQFNYKNLQAEKS